MDRTSILAVVAATLVSVPPALGQSWPTKPIRVIVPSPPGNTFDTITRAVSGHFAAALGRPAIIDNRPGAAGIIGVDAGAKAAPDGYTLLNAGNSHLVFNKVVRAKLPYDPERDFAPVSLLADVPTILYAHPSVPAKTWQQVVAYSKANPGKVNYGSFGLGHATHLITELLKTRTGADLTHVPYKGANFAFQDMLADRVQLSYFSPTANVVSLVRAGKLVPLLLFNSRRVDSLPEVPTVNQAGVQDADVGVWMGLLAPAGTPREIVMRINREVVRIVALPEVNAIYSKQSLAPHTSTPEFMAEKISKELALWTAVVQKIGLKPE